MGWHNASVAGVLTWTIVLAGCATAPVNRKATEHPTVPIVSPREGRPATPTDRSTESHTNAFRGQQIVPAAFVVQPSDTDRSTQSSDVSLVATSSETLQAGSIADTNPIESDPEAIPINLPTALAMIGGNHPVVGFARSRVQEAYAQLDRSKLMWLPSIQSGFNYRRRDGNYQDVQGAIVDVNLNSFNYGLGAGAVGAGSPAQPGVVARFHLADALFLPKAAEKNVWARQHAASATLNQQLLDAAIAYIDLLEGCQELEIVGEAVERTSQLAKITDDYAEAGQGLRADADRTDTELSLLRIRQLAARERQLVASTRLARILSAPMTHRMAPQDPVIVPLDLNEDNADEWTLISTGLSVRPELKESQALVLAACEAYKRERYAPFVPSVLLGFSTTSFGGGLGSSADNFHGRYDLDALMVWEMRNMGFGEAAARRERNAQVRQATFVKLRMMDQVAQEIAAANLQVRIRREQLELAQSAIASARDSYRRNLDRIHEGKGLPIEVLQSIQALESSQRAYLNAVSNYNRAQLQLQWALGWPISLRNS